MGGGVVTGGVVGRSVVSRGVVGGISENSLINYSFKQLTSSLFLQYLWSSVVGDYLEHVSHLQLKIISHTLLIETSRDSQLTSSAMVHQL